MKKKSKFLLLAVAFQYCILSSYSQELYVFSEPASNMAAKSFGLKYNRKSVKVFEYGDRHILSRNMFEAQFGINKKWMIHPSVSFSDMYSNQKMKFESLGLYSKFRFLSIDQVHRHFRGSIYAKGVFSKNNLLYDELTVDGDQSAIQMGLIFTQLIHKSAISATMGISEVLDGERWLKYAGVRNFGYQSLHYSLSYGYLVFPQKYTSFEQTNFNIYVELLGGEGLDRKSSFLDIAPAFQFIIKSNFKINVGYRKQLVGDAIRMGRSGFLLGFERTFLQAFKKRP